MKLKYQFLAAALLTSMLVLPTWVEAEPSHTRFGVEKPINALEKITIKNFQDETLGKIVDLGVDLSNGRIVEVLVRCDSSLGVDNKIVAIPPLAFFGDPLSSVFRLDMTPEVFSTAPGIDMDKWVDSGRSDKVAATYRFFGKEPYFLETDANENNAVARPLVKLGYVERSSKILDMPVRNYNNDKFGTIYSLRLDVPNGLVTTAIILAPGNFKTKTVIPATSLEFNPERNGLLLNQSKLAFRDEPRYVLIAASYGNDAMSKEESYRGPRTNTVLAQGSSYSDVDTTVNINRKIRLANINSRDVQVGTNDGRVTLRGWVSTDADRNRIQEIAVASTRLEGVDNQLIIGQGPSTN